MSNRSLNSQFAKRTDAMTFKFNFDSYGEDDDEEEYEDDYGDRYDDEGEEIW